MMKLYTCIFVERQMLMTFIKFDYSYKHNDWSFVPIFDLIKVVVV